jgi:hypothetical protein
MEHILRHPRAPEEEHEPWKLSDKRWISSCVGLGVERKTKTQTDYERAQKSKTWLALCD